jgi:Tfp pilus assembly PilM family ATPase
LLVASTISTGSDTTTDLISKGLHLTSTQAAKLKNQYGIAYSEKQQRIVDAIESQLDALVHEIQKSIRYYSERAAKSGKKISRVITVGGGAVMPGLNHYLSQELRLPTQNLEPWQKISFGNLPLPAEPDRSMYIAVAGEAILEPAEAAA